MSLFNSKDVKMMKEAPSECEPSNRDFYQLRLSTKIMILVAHNQPNIILQTIKDAAVLPRLSAHLLLQRI